MASLRETLEAPIPRPLLWLGAPILAFVLVLSFVFLGFPYEDLLPAASRELGKIAGGEARKARGPHFGGVNRWRA